MRKARALKNIPRRVLSEKSGVSPRYLAQLEAGEGNISITLLDRVARALDMPVDRLLAEDDPWASDAVQVADLFRAASPNRRRAVLDLLASEPPAARRAGRICLIGLRGAGKSTLGAEAGRALGVPFIELNREIEDRAGMPLAEVMALYGQEGYRALEAQALDAVAGRDAPLILAVAGGIVGEGETYGRLLERFHTIWLRAAPDEHMARVRAQGDTRPMAGNPEAMAQLRAILSAREALYARAEAEFDTTGQSATQSLAGLLSLIDTRQFLQTT